MAWNELDPSGFYFVCFRVGKRKFKRTLKTRSKKTADSLTARVEENLHDIERGRLVVPENVDIAKFLMSDGRVIGPLKIVKQLTLKSLFDAYFDGIPDGSLEASTIYGMKIHRKHLERHFGENFVIRGLTLEDLQGYVASRKVSGATSRKEVVTLRTVWNWASPKLVEGPFPGRKVKYPKTAEKPPFISLAEAEERNDAELWDSVYLTVEDIDKLLKHVEEAKHEFLYPMFTFAAHTGARRSEIMRARLSDVDLKNGWVTIRERKRAHDKKTTRRVPISATLHAALSSWIEDHPGGPLFYRDGYVARSKTRSPLTGYRSKRRPKTLHGRTSKLRTRAIPLVNGFTKDEMHDHFKRVLDNTRWSKLKGWHVFRHSFISALATKGVDQRIIDDFVGHCTEEQRRRYRHLLPTTTKQAIAAVFD